MPDSLTFHYIKSKDHRAKYADGVWGGNTARGYISMSFFSERNPIPTNIEYEKDSNGDIVEVSRETKEGIIRQVHTELLIDVDFAKNLRSWLDEQIKSHEDRFASAPNSGDSK